MTKEKLLIRNAIMTPDGTVLESTHRHDFKSHTDTKTGNTYFVDGGLSYIRRSANGDEIDLCEYNDTPHEKQRETLTWGSYGKHGDQPLRILKIKDMETEHIKAVLIQCNPLKVIRNCMEKELEFRKDE